MAEDASVSPTSRRLRALTEAICADADGRRPELLLDGAEAARGLAWRDWGPPDVADGPRARSTITACDEALDALLRPDVALGAARR
jgi:hypothetical protein